MKKKFSIIGHSVLNLEKLKSYGFKGWQRYLKLKILDKNIIIRGSCKRCGACCRKLSLDVDGRWLRSVSRFKAFAEENSEYQRFKIVDRDLFGYLIFNCEWLGEDGTCKDYNNRLAICKNYPEKELYFTGAEFHRGCGYRFDEVINFERLLNDE